MKGKYYSSVLKVLIFITDFWLIDLAFNVSRKVAFSGVMTDSQSSIFFLIFSLLWIIAGFFYKIYRIDTLSLMRSIGTNLFNAFVSHLLLIITVLATFPVFQISTRFLIVVYTLASVFII